MFTAGEVLSYQINLRLIAYFMTFGQLFIHLAERSASMSLKVGENVV